MMRLPPSLELASAGMSRNAVFCVALVVKTMRHQQTRAPWFSPFHQSTSNITYTNARNHLNTPQHTQQSRMP